MTRCRRLANPAVDPEVIERKHSDYNEENSMLRRPFTSPGYHTTIKEAEYVHPIIAALDYALAILDSGDELHRERAFNTLRTVLSLQDQQPDSPTFGIWSWFWEEPLAKMSPPDWNWADFCGKRLLLTMIRHGDILPEDLVNLMKKAVSNSCEAIIKRNVGPDYTNIAIMGAFVTLIAGELMQEARYVEYGLARLQRLYDYTLQSGAFLEYNSPTYTTVAILDLSVLAVYTQTEEALNLTNELLDITWKMVSEHFHPLLKQWSGPHARSYHTFLAPSHLSFLYMACGGEIPFIDEDQFDYDPGWYCHGVRCPDRWLHLFTNIGVREVVQSLPESPEFQTRTAYTYMTRDYALGSFNHNVMWNQCRNLMAFVRTDEGERGYMRLRFLHDGYDFCSAVFKSEQKKSSVLFGIQFALDGGDTHVSLDPVHGRIQASDLRVRLEIGFSGRAPECVAITEDTVEAAMGSTTMTVRSLYGAMDGFGPFRWEIAQEESTVCLDYVLYQGDRTEIDFNAMEEGLFLFSLTLSEPAERVESGAMVSPSEHTVQASSLETPEQPISLTLKKKPANRIVLFHS
ncbi:hypothetical protein [Paenibacillus sp. N3.4]|uniref:hypothetical protein n=1 Tax=Paenibacillus sp. N3.4 TaxID=2603222 RepID=UPI0011CC55A7|nr:hypothetical protein [Paenibacillus sp. N3.4]TXK71722.1 hypothetical protein FU659_32845 [Paenibacillus sp. N3.4]